MRESFEGGDGARLTTRSRSGAPTAEAAKNAEDQADATANDEPHRLVGGVAAEQPGESTLDRVGRAEAEDQQDNADDDENEGYGDIQGQVSDGVRGSSDRHYGDRGRDSTNLIFHKRRTVTW